MKRRTFAPALATALLLPAFLPDTASAAPDVEHYALDLDIAPQSLLFQATAALTIKNPTGDPTLTQLPLDFVGFSVSSVTWNGAPATFTRDAGALLVTLPTPLAAGTTGTVKVVYSGTPEPYTTAQGDLGVMQGRSITYAINVTEGARYWFPCRDRLDDKATVSLNLTLPKGNVSAGPGSLQQVIDVGGNKEKHSWVMTQPVTPYLLSFAFSDRFVREVYDLNLDSGPKNGDFALLEDSWADGALALEPVPDIVNWLESRYGRFPYDSVGIHEIPFQGAVEQPGNIAMGSYYFAGQGALTQYFAHELSHSWFQGQVTIRTWNDIFLSESAAVWHEILWTEQAEGLEVADTMAKTNLDAYRVGMASEGVFPISQPTELFGYTVYFKGSVVWRLLEHLMGRDTLAAELRGYLQDGNGQAGDGVADLNDFFSRPIFSNTPALQNFRAEWIDRAGLPSYRFGWSAEPGTNGTSLLIRLSQEREPYYFTPIDVEVQYADGTAETLTLTPSSSDFVLEQCLTQTPTAVLLDPRYLVPRGQEGTLNVGASTVCDEGSGSCSSSRVLSAVNHRAAMPLLLVGLVGILLRRRRV